MTRILYSSLFALCLPAIILNFAIRNLKDVEGHRKAGKASRFFERFGIATKSLRKKAKKGGVIFHCVSVGETLAAMKLIEQFIYRHPSIPVTICCTTPTASNIIHHRLGDRVQHVYLPYDLPIFVKKFLNTFQPKLFVILETELWPNLIEYCHARTIPTVLLNARLSQKSCEGYQKITSLSRPMIQKLSMICCQTENDKYYFEVLGAQAKQTKVVGNMKFDIEIDDALRKKSEEFKQLLFPNKRVWLAASTHPSEDEIILEAYKLLVEKHPNLILVLAPRHPDRARAIESITQAMGLSTKRHTSNDRSEVSAEVYIVDTIGELMHFIGCCDLCFVAGSLVPHGGHNPLEPAAFEKPIISGKFVHNFKKIYEDLEAENAVVFAQTSMEIFEKTSNLLFDSHQAQSLGNNAGKYLAKHQGAILQTLSLIESYLELENKIKT